MGSKSDTIYFYDVGDEHGYLCNFTAHPIEIAGKVWPTNEHYFQAMKFEGTDYAEEIRLAETPGESYVLGNSRAHRLRPDWEAVKDDVMRTAVRAKFRQHPDIRARLLGSGTKHIIERIDTDPYWGDGRDGRGLNRLGVILMQVRDELRAAARAEAKRSGGCW